MTRAFFNRVLSAGGAVTRRYLYLVERSADLTRIVRYPRTKSGDCWIVYDEDPGYVCAVYSR